MVCPSCGNLVGVNDERCFNCGRRNPGMWGYAPLLRRLGNDLGFTNLVIGGCVALYLATLLASRGRIGMGGLFILLAPSSEALFLFGASGAIPVFRYDRWWTVLSAGLAARQRPAHPLQHDVGAAARPGDRQPVRPQPARDHLHRRQHRSASSSARSSASLLPGIPILGGAGFTIGASAPIFGLLGALVRYGRRTGSSLVGSQAWGYALTLFIFGLLMPGVDNWAHAGGFAGGYVAALLLDPMQRERPGHLLAALACLGFTLLAVVASLVSGLSLLAGQ